MARIRVAQVDPADLLAALTGQGPPLKLYGVPPDARLFAAWHDGVGKAVVTLEHPSFDDVPAGCLPPIVQVGLLRPAAVSLGYMRLGCDPATGAVHAGDSVVLRGESEGPDLTFDEGGACHASGPPPEATPGWRDRPPLL